MPGRRFFPVILLLLIASLSYSEAVTDQDLARFKQYIKDFSSERLYRDHFIIYHKNRNSANNISWKAEYYYKQILRHIGDPDFRPWEGQQKAEIVLYSDKKEFMQTTGAPPWIGGFAFKNAPILVIYEGTADLQNCILPHELTHLIMGEYFGDRNIPLWLDEGLAQYEQKISPTYDYKKFMMRKVRDGEYIRFKHLFNMDKLPSELYKIPLFYAETASIIDFMRNNFPQAQFTQFFIQFKKNRSVDHALGVAYKGRFKSGVTDFEKEWLKYVGTKY